MPGHVGGHHHADQPGQRPAAVQDKVHRHLAPLLPPHPRPGDLAPHSGGPLQQEVRSIPHLLDDV